MDSFLDPKFSSSTWTLCDTNGEKVKCFFQPWVVSPELALAIVKAERSTSGHISNLDTLRRVQVVPGVLRALLNRAG